MSGLAYGANPKMTPWLLVGDMVPDVHASKFYRRYTTPMFFKSHFLPQPQYRRVIYLLRDGRDAMVSYLHYENSLKGKKLDFLDFVTAEGNLFPCKWHRHVETWMQNPYKAEMLVIKYEDLLEDTVGQLENICKFARLPGDPDMLAFVAESARFNYLQNKEAKHQKLTGRKNGRMTNCFFAAERPEATAMKCRRKFTRSFFKRCFGNTSPPRLSRGTGGGWCYIGCGRTLDCSHFSVPLKRNSSWAQSTFPLTRN